MPSRNICSVSEPHPYESQGSYKILYLSRVLDLLLEWGYCSAAVVKVNLSPSRWNT